MDDFNVLDFGALSLGEGYIDGFITANAADADHDITVETGICRDSTNVVNIQLDAAITKRIDALWAAGTGQGGLDTGAVAADTTYHLFAIRRSDTGEVDALFSLSVSAPTLPTNYDTFRRVASVMTDSSANIFNYFQVENTFYLKLPISDLSSTNPGTGMVTFTASTPIGVINYAIMSFRGSTITSALGAFLGSLQTDNFFPSSATTTIDFILKPEAEAASVIKNAFTDTLARLKFRLSASSTDVTISISTEGWVDFRGQQ